jgi:hypothetical protein
MMINVWTLVAAYLIVGGIVTLPTTSPHIVSLTSLSGAVYTILLWPLALGVYLCIYILFGEFIFKKRN